MTPAEISQLFEPWRKKHLRPAWRPLVESDAAGRANSWFGGTPINSSSDNWPSCQQCQKPMQFFLQLDCAEFPQAFDAPLDRGLIQLFYCGTDDGTCATWEPFSGTHEIRVVSGETRQLIRPRGVEPLPKTVITGWQEIQDAPHPEEHESLGLSYQYDFAKYRVSVTCQDPPLAIRDVDIALDVAENIAMPRNGDKLGGWPYWVQGAEYPLCPECGQAMELLFQIDSEDNLPYMFGDVGCAHLTQCRKHPSSLAFGWACG